MTYFRFIFIFTMLIQLCACASGPVNNVDFNKDVNLENLGGTYENKMEATENIQALFSTHIWPFTKDTTHKKSMNIKQHKNIDYVNITYTNSGLMFEAISNGCVAVQKTIEIDGSFESGQFEINSTYKNWSEVHIGPWYNRITLGIDIAGNAKLRSLDRVGGMIFWIIPFVAFETWDHRLNKLTEKQYFPTCEVMDYWSS